MRALGFQIERQVSAVPSVAWTALADTDRISQLGGFGIRFAAHDGQIVGSIRHLGSEMRFGERPYDFVLHRWIRFVRKYQNGPVAESTIEIRFEPSPTGTRYVYDLKASPRYALLGPVVSADLWYRVRRALSRAIDELQAEAEGRPAPKEPRPLDRAEEFTAQLGPVIGAALIDRIRVSSLHRATYLAPLALAREWNADPQALLVGFIELTRRGLLSLRWTLICPRCGASQADAQTPDLLPGQAHCMSCQVVFDRALPESLAATFHPPGLPPPRTECVMNVARSPQRMFTLPISSGVEVSIPDAGTYRLAVLGEDHGLLVVAEPGGPAETDVVYRPPAFVPRTTLLAPGGKLRVRAEASTQEVRLQLARRSPPEQLTLGRVLRAGGQDLVGTLATAGVATREVFLAIDHPFGHRAVGRLLEGLRPSMVAAGGAGALTSWSTVAEALRMAWRVAREGFGCALLHVGPATVSHGTWVGAAAEQATLARHQLAEGAVAVHHAALDDALLIEALALQRHVVTVGPQLGDIHRLQFLLPNLRPGDPTEVGPYRLVEVLGEGGMGTVFRCRHADTGEAAAIKVLSPSRATESNGLERFRREAAILRTLDHPAIVRVIDSGEGDRGPWLAMELLHGHDLHQELYRNGCLPAAKAARWFQGPVDALTQADAQGVTHRDLKPSNLFVCDQGALVKLLDFGVAIRDEDPSLTRGGVVGTMSWMAPEQLDGAAPHPSADVYSLGLVLYRALSGSFPWVGETALSRAVERLRTEPRALPPELSVPARLEEVVRGCLSVLPAARPSLPEVVTVLSQVADEPSTDAD